MCHIKKPLFLAVGVNSFIFIGELFGGVIGHSNSLLMDGVHNFSDELALICLYMAYLLPIKMSKNLQRVANMLNSVGLIMLSGFVIYQSIERLIHPSETLGFIPFIAGILAAVANFGVAKLLYPVKEQNSAICLAYLHNL
jgi:Co/Zn/Cd efflux system component